MDKRVVSCDRCRKRFQKVFEKEEHSNQCSATRVRSQHTGFSARARIARVLACNLLIFENPARARGVAEH